MQRLVIRRPYDKQEIYFYGSRYDLSDAVIVCKLIGNWTNNYRFLIIRLLLLKLKLYASGVLTSQFLFPDLHWIPVHSCWRWAQSHYLNICSFVIFKLVAIIYCMQYWPSNRSSIPMLHLYTKLIKLVSGHSMGDGNGNKYSRIKPCDPSLNWLACTSVENVDVIC